MDKLSDEFMTDTPSNFGLEQTHCTVNNPGELALGVPILLRTVVMLGVWVGPRVIKMNTWAAKWTTRK